MLFIHETTDADRLHAAKLVHTVVGVIVAGAIVALYPAVALDYRLSLSVVIHRHVPRALCTRWIA